MIYINLKIRKKDITMVSFTFTTNRTMMVVLWERLKGLYLTVNSVWIHKDRTKEKKLLWFLGLMNKTVRSITRELCCVSLPHNGHTKIRKLCSFLDVTIKDELGQIGVWPRWWGFLETMSCGGSLRKLRIFSFEIWTEGDWVVEIMFKVWTRMLCKCG